MLKQTAVAIVAVSLTFAWAGCKKDKKEKGKDEAADKAGGATKEPTPPTEPKPKLETPEDQVAFYQACTAAVNGKEWDTFSRCYTEGAKSEVLDSGQPALSGREAIVEKGIKPWATAFPDLTLTPTVILQSGKRVASIMVMTGTHKGPLTTPLGEVPPTDKKVGVYVFHMVDIDPAGGGVASEWIASDMATVVAQLGQSEMPARKAMEVPTGEPTVVIAKNDDAEKANLEAYEKLLAEPFNKRDIDTIQKSYADDVKFIDIAGPADADKKMAKSLTGDFFKGFPDVKAEVVDKFAAGDYVVARTVMTGTNSGDMSSMKKTGKKIDLHPFEVAKIQGGKVKEHWLFYSGLAMAMQLGILLPPDPAAPAEGGAPKEGAPKEGAPKEGAPK